jgi:hypothetical protein
VISKVFGLASKTGIAVPEAMEKKVCREKRKEKNIRMDFFKFCAVRVFYKDGKKINPQLSCGFIILI